MENSILDRFGHEEHNRLYWLKKDMEIGERSDWSSWVASHLVEMTWKVPKDVFDQLPKWQDQLCELFANSRVESLLPGDRADSIGDRWAKYRSWKWTSDERIELL
jgi:hypothetical protein